MKLRDSATQNKIMVPFIQTQLATRDFIDRYGDNSQYELINGELLDSEPTGPDEEVAAFIGRKLNVAIEQQNEPFLIPYRCLVSILGTECLVSILGTETAFRPDVIVLDQTQLVHEPLWQREPIVSRGSSIKLIAEVVSTNWQNDYARKSEDYALLGVPKYWIVDYLGLGGRDYIGKPKQPTLTLCKLKGDEYEKQILRDNDRLSSQIFPSLQLKVEQIIAAGK